MDLQASKRLLASGKADAAYVLLKQIIETNPESMPARTTMVDAMIQAGRGLEAIDSLNSLRLDAIPQNDRALLEAVR